MLNSYPDKDPANTGSLAGSQAAAFRKQIMKHYGQLPAEVVSYDRVRNVARVRPLIDVLHTDGNSTQRATLAEVPVLSLGGGGVNITFDLNPGDLGWIEASARDISLFMQSLKRSRPATIRLNSLEDSRFVPDVFRQYQFPAGAGGHMCIQSTDGTTFIALKSGHVAVSTQGTADITAAGGVNVMAPTTTITGNVNITGTLTLAGVVVNDHDHPGITVGDANTGPMQ